MSSDKLFDHLYLTPDAPVKRPTYKNSEYLIDGKLVTWTGATNPVRSPVWVQGAAEPTVIGSYPMHTEKEAREAVEAAVRAYNNGRGVWPQLSVNKRIEYVEQFNKGLEQKRDEISNLLMWEICKTKADSEKEVTRTIEYINDTIKELKSIENKSSTFVSEKGVFAQIRRAPLGVVLCSGPFNYPFNETYTTLIPAIIMGKHRDYEIAQSWCALPYTNI